ncbi:hypothetical protein THRCLA_00145 [Thraustotheca clavata]|uniref:Uncharacterized protein n=1 Tax=Thraustotheca clavata TaxID=74557 RepID=A0A1W0AC19_9STRA|nr:hypothetical protein THRCLA_00145 [Thraustotheca clavata]
MNEYGELVVLGYSSYRVANGDTISTKGQWQPVGSPNCHFRLGMKKVGNGLERHRSIVQTCEKTIDSLRQELQSPSSQFVSIPTSNSSSCFIEYVPNLSLDMFQIGRQPSRFNDFSVPGPIYGTSGTISRFAARFVCERSAPYRCRLFAGGFDASRMAVVPSSSLKYCAFCNSWMKTMDCKCISTSSRPIVYERNRDNNSETDGVPVDALTKNGVRIWMPEQKVWYEVSVNGFLYAIQDDLTNSSFHRPTSAPAALEALVTHGCIIDLGGVQLQFLSKRSRRKSSIESMSNPSLAVQLESLNIQCPVQLHPLKFQNDSDLNDTSTPYVFPACGHVFGFDPRIARGKCCPMCRALGSMVPLKLASTNGAKLHQAEERNRIPDSVFNPCGHAVGSKCAKYYASIRMPNGKSICPICAVALDQNLPYTKLYLHIDDDL